jgi:hypothetical protein
VLRLCDETLARAPSQHIDPFCSARAARPIKVERYGRAGTFEDLINAAAEHEEPWNSRHDRNEPVGLS